MSDAETEPETGEREIAVVTGTRAEYGLLKPAMDEITRTPSLSLSVIVTGMHLSAQYGYTIDDIRADGFTISREVHMLLDGDSGTAMAKSLGIGTAGLAEAFASVDPDLVLVLGDRDEALAAGMAAAHMNVPVAHVHGGDSMDGAIIDDSIRHALTKFAHVHFPVSERSAARIRKLGEEDWRITTTGAPGLDAVLAGEYDSPNEVREKHGLAGDGPLALVVQHPVTSRPERAGEQMRATLDALCECAADEASESGTSLQAAVIYPNSDAGGRRIIETIEEAVAEPEIDLHTFKSLPRREFLGLMAGADVMVGNSSSAIIEAPSFSLPVVDVGPRQEGRERADNTISVPHEKRAIGDAISRCLTDDAVGKRARECENPYDYGGAGTRIAARLAGLEFGEKLLRKRLTY